MAELYLNVRTQKSNQSLDGTPIKVPGDARAAAKFGDSINLTVEVPGTSMTETRYVVDQAVRKIASATKLSSGRLSAEVDEVALPIGLDLFNRFNGKVTLSSPAYAESLEKVGKYESLYRSWVNQDPTERTSIAICDDVVAWGKEQPVDVEVLGEKEINQKGLRLLEAVGGASDISPPRLVLAHYKGKGKTDAPLALVGKGVTFDSGGLNVKPYESFVSMMKNDMGGSALAYSLFKALVESHHPDPLLLVIPTCENAIGSRSMRPGALVKSFAGPTVRIDHTDAEGRLILADGIAYADKKYNPSAMMCFATLTTSALISYGPYATPVHFADSAQKEKLERASKEMGEDMHFFPKRIWHEMANRDQEADIRNTARLNGHAARGAGSRNAAHFLLAFTKKPLLHLDIFASTWNWAGDAPGCGYGATGAPLRTLLRYFNVS